MAFKTLDQINLRGQRVFIRCDLNVPLDAAGRISDDTRIRASLPGIRHALQQRARVMVTSHLGRPAEGALGERDSLRPVAERLAQLLRTPVPLVHDWLDRPIDVAPGSVVVLENCRANPGEKANDARLARRMAAMCDVYVNDAFGTAHRAEATTEALARLAGEACAGPLMAAELQALGRALATPERPMAAIVGGAKVSTKLAILNALAQRVELLVVGGGMANTLLLAAGQPVGKSLCEPSMVDAAREVMATLKARGGRLFLPTDVVVADEVSEGAPPTSSSTSARSPCAAWSTSWTPARPSSGTGRWACSRSRSSRTARACWPRPSPARQRSRSPAAATRWRRSTSSVWPTASTTCPPLAAPSSNSWKARPCLPCAPCKTARTDPFNDWSP